MDARASAAPGLEPEARKAEGGSRFPVPAQASCRAKISLKASRTRGPATRICQQKAMGRLVAMVWIHFEKSSPSMPSKMRVATRLIIGHMRQTVETDLASRAARPGIGDPRCQFPGQGPSGQLLDEADDHGKNGKLPGRDDEERIPQSPVPFRRVVDFHPVDHGHGHHGAKDDSLESGCRHVIPPDRGRWIRRRTKKAQIRCLDSRLHAARRLPGTRILPIMSICGPAPPVPPPRPRGAAIRASSPPALLDRQGPKCLEWKHPLARPLDPRRLVLGSGVMRGTGALP